MQIKAAAKGMQKTSPALSIIIELPFYPVYPLSYSKNFVETVMTVSSSGTNIIHTCSNISDL